MDDLRQRLTKQEPNEAMLAVTDYIEVVECDPPGKVQLIALTVTLPELDDEKCTLLFHIKDAKFLAEIFLAEIKDLEDL